MVCFKQTLAVLILQNVLCHADVKISAMYDKDTCIQEDNCPLTWLTTVTRHEGSCACRAADTPRRVLVKLAKHCRAATAAMLSEPGTDCCKLCTSASEAFSEQFSRAAEPSMLTLKACIQSHIEDLSVMVQDALNKGTMAGCVFEDMRMIRQQQTCHRCVNARVTVCEC